MRKLLTILALFAAVPALAATTPNTYVAPVTPNVGAVRFVQGTDLPGTFKTIYTGGANGSKCFSLMVNWNDQSATHALTLRITTGGVGYDMATYTTYLGGLAANTFNVPVDLFLPSIWPGLPVDISGNTYIYLKSGDTLQATYATALTATDQINFVAFCGDF